MFFSHISFYLQKKLLQITIMGRDVIHKILLRLVILCSLFK